MGKLISDNRGTAVEPTTPNYHLIFGDKRAKYNALFNELVKQYNQQHGNVNGGIAIKIYRVYKIWYNYANKPPFSGYAPNVDDIYLMKKTRYKI